MENNEQKQENKITFGKVFLIIFLYLLISSGLFGTLCGGFFTINFLLYPGGGYEFYPLSVSSFILGVLFIYISYKLINNKFNLTKIQKVIIFSIGIISWLIISIYFFIGF